MYSNKIGVWHWLPLTNEMIGLFQTIKWRVYWSTENCLILSNRLDCYSLTRKLCVHTIIICT